MIFDPSSGLGVADKDTWRAARDAMVPIIDAQYGVYARNNAGDWTFNLQRFENYLEEVNPETVAEWVSARRGDLRRCAIGAEIAYPASFEGTISIGMAQ